MTTPATPKGVKHREPDVFTGKRSETDCFIWEVKNFLKGNEKQFVDEDERISWLLGLLQGGEAIDWAIDWESTNSTATTPVTTVAGLIAAIQDHFKPINEQAEARHQLKTSRQGSLTAEEYTAKFKQWAKKAQITEDSALIGYFQDGIQKGLSNRIKLNVVPNPTTIQAWYKHAAQHDSNWVMNFKREFKPRNNTTPFRSRAMNETPRNPNFRFPTLSKQERDDHMKKGQCFSCHEIGHVSRDCPKKASGSQNNRFQGNNQGRNPIWKRAQEMKKEEPEDEETQYARIVSMLQGNRGEGLFERLSQQDF